MDTFALKKKCMHTFIHFKSFFKFNDKNFTINLWCQHISDNSHMLHALFVSFCPWLPNLIFSLSFPRSLSLALLRCVLMRAMETPLSLWWWERLSPVFPFCAQRLEKPFSLSPGVSIRLLKKTSLNEDSIYCEAN